jgi:hypothetical protein
MMAFLKNAELQPLVEEPWIDNHVPGTVGAIMDWILAYSIRPNPVMALGVSLVVVGTVIGRKVKGPQDCATHLYIIILAPTGFGKDDPLNCGRRLLTAYKEELLGIDEFVSSQGIWRFLRRHPLCCCFVDELGEQIALINDQKSNPFVGMVFGALKKCYNGWGEVRTAAKADEDSHLIRCPAPSIVGAGVPEIVFRSLEYKDLTGGFLNRVLVLPFEGHKKPPEKIRTVPADPPEELLNRLRALPQLRWEVDKPILSEDKLPPPLEVGWSDDGAQDVYLALSKRMDEREASGDAGKDLCQRICENSLRIATIIAVGRGAHAVGKRDIEFAIDLCERSFDAVVGGAQRYMYERFEFPRMCEAVLSKISAYGGVARIRDLKRDFRNSIRWGNELQRVFDHLVGEESIVFDKNLNDGPGPASPGFWLKERK